MLKKGFELKDVEQSLKNLLLVINFMPHIKNTMHRILGL
jgi:hypothetical protein